MAEGSIYVKILYNLDKELKRRKYNSVLTTQKVPYVLTEGEKTFFVHYIPQELNSRICAIRAGLKVRGLIGFEKDLQTRNVEHSVPSLDKNNLILVEFSNRAIYLDKPKYASIWPGALEGILTVIKRQVCTHGDYLEKADRILENMLDIFEMNTKELRECTRILPPCRLHNLS